MQDKIGKSVFKERFKSNRSFKNENFLHLNKQNLRTAWLVNNGWSVTTILLNLILVFFYILIFEACLTQKHHNLRFTVIVLLKPYRIAYV